jgi:phosphomevalonate kinase
MLEQLMQERNELQRENNESLDEAVRELKAIRALLERIDLSTAATAENTDKDKLAQTIAKTIAASFAQNAGDQFLMLTRDGNALN